MSQRIQSESHYNIITRVRSGTLSGKCLRVSRWNLIFTYIHFVGITLVIQTVRRLHFRCRSVIRNVEESTRLGLSHKYAEVALP